MANKKTVITLIHGSESYQTVVDRLLKAPSRPREELLAFRNFFHAAAGGDRSVEAIVQVNSGDEVLAHGTLTLSTGIATDTAVINSVTLTCVDHRETMNVTYAADSAGSLNSKYFTFQDQTGLNKYYVWFNINAAGVDPQIAGRVGIKVSGATSATAATLGAATTTACAATTSAKVTLGADVSGSLNNTYFTFKDAAGVNKYYVWYNINSAGTDPALAGYTGIQVRGATGASAATLATATALACANVNGFQVVNPSSTVVNIYGFGGVAAITKDSVLTPTNFVFTQAINNVLVSNGSSGHVIFTNVLAGTATATADGAATSTGFTFTRSITGSAVTSAQYNVAASDTLTAVNLAAAINANSSLAQVATATSAAAVVTVSSFYPGPIGNLITTTASGAVTAGQAVLASGALATTSSAINTYHSGV